MRHLLVTNDFPPKVGGIQSYLWELWKRLPPEETTVLTASHKGSDQWDAQQDFRIVRRSEPVLVPHPLLYRQVRKLVSELGAEAVIVDPIVPLGPVGFGVGVPVGLIAHGAEVTIPGRLPVGKQVMGAMLRNADFVIGAAQYPLDECERAAGRSLNGVSVPPGVDVDRFVPLSASEIREARNEFGLPADKILITSVSRLVPRKGMDVLIEAVSRLDPVGERMHLAIAGTGREGDRLKAKAAKLSAPVTFMDRLSDEQLPLFYGCGDTFAMLCRDRWMGLEQEGFGIVFLEAAACAVPQVAGRSGGSHEAVAHGVGGLVVDDPADVGQVADALDELVSDKGKRIKMGKAARERAVAEFSYDHLAQRLDDFLNGQRSVGRGSVAS